jgi:hypothetical protein
MAVYEIIEGNKKIKIDAISDMDKIRELVKEKVRSHGAESEAEQARRISSSPIPPDVIPIPGTPDFAEYRMDGAV